MKLFHLDIVPLLVAPLILFSCKNDDKLQVIDIETFSLDEDTREITSAVFIKDIDPGTDDNGNDYYRNELLFMQGMTLTDTNGELVASGDGHYVSLLINNEGRELEPGTYTWQTEENEQAFDLWAGYVTMDWNTEARIDYELTSGTVIIAKTGDVYTITFEGIAYLDGELIPDTDVAVTLEYDGPLAQLEREF